MFKKFFEWIANLFRKSEPAPLPPRAEPTKPKEPIPEPVEVKPAPIEDGYNATTKMLTVLGHTAAWDKKADPFGEAYFRNHPGYGRDIRLPRYIMKFWMDNVPSKEIPGNKHNPLIVWFHKKFTWLKEKYHTDETAHCKSGWNASCEVGGFTVGDSAMALDGMKEGVAVDANDAQIGDFCILYHIDSKGNYTNKHHITYWESYSERRVYGMGSNQNNEINVSSWYKQELRKGSVRRLTLKQSKLPEVARSA